MRFKRRLLLVQSIQLSFSVSSFSLLDDSLIKRFALSLHSINLIKDRCPRPNIFCAQLQVNLFELLFNGVLRLTNFKATNDFVQVVSQPLVLRSLTSCSFLNNPAGLVGEEGAWVLCLEARTALFWSKITLIFDFLRAAALSMHFSRGSLDAY